MTRPLNRIPANKRTSLASVTVRGVDLTVLYFTEGTSMPATAGDPAESPVVYVVSVEAHGDISQWIDEGAPEESEIAEAVEDELALPAAYGDDGFLTRRQAS